MKTLYLDTDDKLLELNNLSNQTRLALDSEFIRERTYYPVLSLVQLATDKQLYLVDALAIQNLNPLCELLFNSETEKTVHCIYQDAEILETLCKKKLKNIFDTQLAAAFLGFELQVSYKALVYAKLNISLDKSETRSDWLRRPLSSQQLNYAKEDVIHLFELQDLLLEELHGSGKYDWFTEETRSQTHSDNDYCKQFLDKDVNMNPQQLARLKALLEWREQKAQYKNLPRQWIVNDSCLKELAMQNHSNRAPGRNLKNCSKTRDYRIDEMFKLLSELNTEHSASTHSNQPSEPPPSTQKIRARIKKMRKTVTELAAEHDIAPALIINKKQLTAIASNQMQANAFPGWRADLVSQIIND